MRRPPVEEPFRLRWGPAWHGWKVEAWLGGRVVSWLIVNDLTWRIGTAAVRIGGIGGVGTDRAFRRRGFSRRCMDAAVAFMTRQGLPMSGLFGIPAFYPKWGYTPVIPEPRVWIATTDAAEARPDPALAVVPYDPRAHAPAVRSIYLANNRDRTGSVVRRPYIRHFRIGSDWGIRTESFVLNDAQGRVRGYAAHDVPGRDLVVTEVGYADRSVFPTLTAELVRRANARKAPGLRVLAPADHPYAAYLRRWNAETTEATFKDGQGMARLLSTPRTLAACAGELGRRLAASGLARASFRLVFDTDAGAATLSARGGRVRVLPGLGEGTRVPMPQDALTRLLFGTATAEDEAARPGSRIPARALPALRALFPPAHPYCWPTDRF